MIAHFSFEDQKCWDAILSCKTKSLNVKDARQCTWGQHSNVHCAKVRMVQTPFPYGHLGGVLWDGHDVTGVN